MNTTYHEALLDYEGMIGFGDPDRSAAEELVQRGIAIIEPPSGSLGWTVVKS